MKHLTRDEVVMRQLLLRSRSIAVVGASPRPERHSHQVCRYLHNEGYEVLPVRPDLAEVAGMKSYQRLADIPGPIDIVVLYRAPEAAPAHIAEVAHKRPEVVWLPPGVWTRACDDEAARLGVSLVVDACIEEEHRHASHETDHPRKLGAHLRRRKREHFEGGGGGHAGGGGVRATLDEKKMVAGRPSPRRGILRLLRVLRLHGRRH